MHTPKPWGICHEQTPTFICHLFARPDGPTVAEVRWPDTGYESQPPGEEFVAIREAIANAYLTSTDMKIRSIILSAS